MIFAILLTIRESENPAISFRVMDNLISIAYANLLRLT